MPSLRAHPGGLPSPARDSRHRTVRRAGCGRRLRDALGRPAARLLLSLGLVGVACDRSRPEPEGEPASAVHLDRAVRVLLLEQVPDCEVALDEPFELVQPDTQVVVHPEATVRRLTVVFGPSGIRFPQLGTEFDLPAVELRPLGTRPIELRLSEQWSRFPGRLRFLRQGEGAGAVVNVLDMEPYLIGVVASEFPADFHPEAFKAQAIAARTYAWYIKQTAGRRRDWDLWSTESSQVYQGLQRQRLVPRAAQAVRETRGIVCTWPAPEGERIFCTYYCARCGGTTQAAGPVKNEPIIPPLAGGVACAFCRRPDAEKWSDPVVIPKTAVTERLVARYSKFASIGPVERIDIVESTPDGRAVRVSVRGARGNGLELEAENLRLVLDPTGRDLRSTYFSVAAEGEAIVFRGGGGFGHGLGMCQQGANAMAEAGARAGEILRHYYPGSRLTRVY